MKTHLIESVAAGALEVTTFCGKRGAKTSRVAVYETESGGKFHAIDSDTGMPEGICLHCFKAKNPV